MVGFPRLRTYPRPMRIDDRVKKSVVFFGYPDGAPGRGGIRCIGTGFLMAYHRVSYLVTNAHVSRVLGADPFLIRVNRSDGTAENLLVDRAEWCDHPDATVDVSITPFFIDILKYDCVYLDLGKMTPERFAVHNIGAGNFTYTVGLFRLLSGEKRNLPVVHTGHIAMMPGDERIPVRDWTDPKKQKTVLVEGYLVEAQTLSGLSGSPVFVRPEIIIDMAASLRPNQDVPEHIAKSKALIVGPLDSFMLLGVWQGAWEAKPEEALAAEIGKEVRVSVGMGVVVPYQKIMEVLDLPNVKKHREAVIAGERPHAAELDVAIPDARELIGPDANPNHLEDFTRLVDVAARKKSKANRGID